LPSPKFQTLVAAFIAFEVNDTVGLSLVKIKGLAEKSALGMGYTVTVVTAVSRQPKALDPMTS